MIVTSDFLAATFKGFQALFNKVLNEYVPEWARLAMETTSTTKTESYSFPGSPPAMREWKDERQIAGMVTANFEIANKKFEATIGVDRETLEDDKLTMIRPQIEGLSISAARHPGKLIHDLIRDGAATTCWDGQYFFDTDHVFGQSGAQSNKLTGTGITAAQLKADWATVRKNFLKFKDDRGEALGLVPDLVVCPPELEVPFRELFNAVMISSTSNVLVGQADVLVSPELTDVNDWYAFVTKTPLKPFVMQWRQRPEFSQLATPNTDNAFMRDQYYYGVRARYNVGYGLYQLGCMVTNT